MKKVILMFMVLSMLLVGCNASNNENNASVTLPIVITTNWSFGSIDLDFMDEEYLLKIAQYKGGSVEDRAYTMLVVLNRANEDMFTEKYKEYVLSEVQAVVLDELYDVEGLKPDDFEGIIPDNETRKAMKMIKYDGFDNSNGSFEYK